MACSSNGVVASLTAAGFAIAAAVGFIAVAASLNASFWTAAGSPALMFAAAGATGGAVAGVVAAVPLMIAYVDCLRRTYPPPPPQVPAGSIITQLTPCATNGSTWYSIVTTLGMTLTAQVLACLKAAGVAWIPLLGLAPMLVIAGTLVAQGVLIVALIASSVDFANCLGRSYRKP